MLIYLATLHPNSTEKGCILYICDFSCKCSLDSDRFIEFLSYFHVSCADDAGALVWCVVDKRISGDMRSVAMF